MKPCEQTNARKDEKEADNLKPEQHTYLRYANAPPTELASETAAAVHNQNHPSHQTLIQMRVKEHNRRGKLPDQKGDVSEVVRRAKPEVKARAAA